MTKSLVQDDSLTKLRPVTMLLCNDFFFRTWIVQEVSLARNMILKLGRQEVLWSDFMDLVGSFTSICQYYPPAFYLPVASTNTLAMTQAIDNISMMQMFRRLVEAKPIGLPLN